MADAEVAIIIKATDKASAVLKGVNKSIGSFKTNISELGKSVPGLGNAMNLLTNPITLVGGGIAAIASGMGEAVKKANDYALSMGDLSKVWGTSVEEASKLVQVADDVRISQESMSAAMRIAMRQGVEPTIAGIKDAAKTYQNFTNTQERATWAAKTFGRNWTEVARLLELTPEQIDDSTAAAEKFGLVIGQDNVEAAKQYYAALDNLNDAQEGLAISVGSKLIPVWTKVIETFNEGTTAGFEIGEELVTLGDLIFQRLMPNLAKLTDEVYNVTSNMSAGMGDIKAYEAGIIKVGEAADGAEQANNNLSLAIGGVTKAALGKTILDDLTLALNENGISAGEFEARAYGVMTSMLGMTGAEAEAVIELTYLNQAQGEGAEAALNHAAAVETLSDKLYGLDGKTFHSSLIIDVQQRGGGVNIQGGQITTPGTTPRTAPRSTTPNIRGGQISNARGADYTVPMGYSGERWNLGTASSGETVKITPAGQTSNADLIAAIKSNRLDESRLVRLLRDQMAKAYA